MQLNNLILLTANKYNVPSISNILDKVRINSVGNLIGNILVIMFIIGLVIGGIATSMGTSNSKIDDRSSSRNKSGNNRSTLASRLAANQKQEKTNDTNTQDADKARSKEIRDRFPPAETR